MSAPDNPKPASAEKPVESTIVNPSPPPAKHAHKTPVKRIIVGIVVLVAVIAAVPWIIHVLNTVSTDDAYVNGHFTFVAARVPGQVTRVLVDDNNHVHKGDLLVQLDKEPYQVQVNIAQAAVDQAQADLVVANATVRGIEGQMRSSRFNLDHAIEDVDNQVALLSAKVATLESQKATVDKTQDDYDRALPLIESGSVSREELDHRKQALLVAQAQFQEALQGVYQIRVALGLPPKPAAGGDLAQVPDNLDQTFSTVRQAQAILMQAAAQVGVTDSFNITPKQLIVNFYRRDPDGDIDRIYAKLAADAPPIKQAQAKLYAAQKNLDQAKLNLRYTDVFAEIDGVIDRREVNPGDNVIAGQSLMVVRSLTDIWVDGNFKETQLADLRIGQAVDLDVDMYGSRQHFNGRISGFTNGTGSTLALLPAENATGNFVKVVQRLPVRIDLVDYDPDKSPLFVGLSVTPTVDLTSAPTGPDAGKVLQPYLFTSPPAGGAETQP
jgi:membrane fusion protein, multidrug efflux system